MFIEETENILRVPGFGIVIVKKSLLAECADNARSVSLNIYEQEKGLNTNGQFRFTPPTHTICAFKRAIDELNDEGGVLKRNERYTQNKLICCDKSIFFSIHIPLSH